MSRARLAPWRRIGGCRGPAAHTAVPFAAKGSPTMRGALMMLCALGGLWSSWCDQSVLTAVFACFAFGIFALGTSSPAACSVWGVLGVPDQHEYEHEPQACGPEDGRHGALPSKPPPATSEQAQPHASSYNLKVASSSISSPVCALTQAAKASNDDSGQSINAAPAAVVDSMQAVAALRRTHLRYRQACRYASNGAAPRHTQLHLKLPGIEPADLQPGFIIAVNDSLRVHGSALQVVGASVRRGCVELSLDLLERDPAYAAAGVHAEDALLDEALDLPALILSAMGVTPPSAGAGGGIDTLHIDDGDGDADGGAEHAVFVQRRGACWSLQWDPDAMTWTIRDKPDAGGFGPGGAADGAAAASDGGVVSGVCNGGGDAGSGVSMFAPIAVLATEQLAARGRSTLRLALVVHGCDAASFGSSSTSSSSSGSGGGGVAATGSPLTLIAKANGRSVVVPVASATRSVAAAAAADGWAAPCGAVPLACAAVVLHVDLDVAHLAAGRPDRSPGLVIRLELWRGAAAASSSHSSQSSQSSYQSNLSQHRAQQRHYAYAPPLMLSAVCVACLRDVAAATELLCLQRDLAASGELDPEDDAFLSGPQQREEADQLLGDLAAWLDYCAALHRSAAGVAREGPGEAGCGDGDGGEGARRNELDLSGEVGHLLLHPQLQPTLLATGQHLLEHFVHHGRVALARCMQRELEAAAAVVADAGGPAAEAAAAGATAFAAAPPDGGEALTLLHRAVRSGSQATVEMVLQWLCGGGGVAANTAAWAARAPGGVTPLHILAAEARCLSPAREEDDFGGAALMAPRVDSSASSAAEALLRYIMNTYPAAVTVWNTARDGSGNTPAVLWSVLGGHDMQVQAAVEALEQAVAVQPGLLSSPSAAPSSATTAAAPDAGASTTAAAACLTAAQPGRGTGGRLDESLVSSPPSLMQLVGLAVRGFADPAVERSYVDYVTLAGQGTTAMWVIIMVAAHVAAFYKSLHSGDSRQALIGGFSYTLTLVLMVTRPRMYHSAREPLMLCCLMGRTLCRAMLSWLPSWFHMSDDIIKYVVYGLDILLDGFLEGTFEQLRFTRAAAARLLEWPISAAFMTSHGVVGTYRAALLRSAAASGVGLAMSAFMDIRMRASFLRHRRAAAVRGDGGGGAMGTAVGAVAAAKKTE